MPEWHAKELVDCILRYHPQELHQIFPDGYVEKPCLDIQDAAHFSSLQLIDFVDAFAQWVCGGGNSSIWFY